MDNEDFSSGVREVLWNLLRHYGIPEKYIQKTYQKYICKVIHNGGFLELIEMLIEMFSVIDWTMWQTTVKYRDTLQRIITTPL